MVVSPAELSRVRIRRYPREVTGEGRNGSDCSSDCSSSNGGGSSTPSISNTILYSKLAALLAAPTSERIVIN